MTTIYDKIETKVSQGEFDDILTYHDWRHRIPIREGFSTPGYLSDNYWNLSNFPNDLKGKSVLDIGSNDGINSFHSERIGARSVLGIDLYKEGADLKHTSGWSPTGCAIAKAALNSNVEFKPLSLFDLGTLNQSFDVVLFADVMNWLTDLPTAINSVSSVCNERLIIRDGLIRKKEGVPYLQYVHSPEMDLMFLPNATFMEVILKQNGFKHISIQKIKSRQLLEEVVSDFPLVTSATEVQIYASPWSTEPVRTMKMTAAQALSKVEDRLFIRRIGWVKVSDVSAEIFRPRALYSFARKMFGKNAVMWLKDVLSQDVDESYTIVATR
ncbi:MAG: methyltransferase domain-containing protein [Bacteroidetes bacterium]|nr:methyltransferase domain-containing protein [Bacteroidota bacterium]